MLYLFYFQGFIISLFIAYYTFQFLYYTSHSIKLFEVLQLIFLSCCLSPFLIIILIKYFNIYLINNGIFTQYQKNFFINFDQYLVNLIILYSLIIFSISLILILYYFFYKKKINYINKKPVVSNSYFYIGLTFNLIILIIYTYVSCFNNDLSKIGGMTLPYLINSYLQTNMFLFNTFFIFNLPLLFLIFSFVFEFRNKKFNYLLMFISIIIYVSINYRSASITPLLNIFILISILINNKYKSLFILFFFIALVNLHHIKSQINAYFVSPCFSSLQLFQKI